MSSFLFPTRSHEVKYTVSCRAQNWCHDQIWNANHLMSQCKAHQNGVALTLPLARPLNFTMDSLQMSFQDPPWESSTTLCRAFNAQILTSPQDDSCTVSSYRMHISHPLPTPHNSHPLAPFQTPHNSHPLATPLIFVQGFWSIRWPGTADWKAAALACGVTISIGRGGWANWFDAVCWTFVQDVLC